MTCRDSVDFCNQKQICKLVRQKLKSVLENNGDGKVRLYINCE